MAGSSSNVDRVYDALRQMAVDFAFKPDQRVNESALAAQLNTSRTPLREALNRLVAEGLITFQTNRGFFCRSLTPQSILDLYEARVAVECEALRLACSRASDAQIAGLQTWMDSVDTLYQTGSDPVELLELDEEFHLRIAGLSGNSELVRLLKGVNDRIRYTRLIDLKDLRAGNRGDPGAHCKIMNALIARNADSADQTMRTHIEKRREEATQAVQRAFSQLYVPQE